MLRRFVSGLRLDRGYRLTGWHDIPAFLFLERDDGHRRDDNRGGGESAWSEGFAQDPPTEKHGDERVHKRMSGCEGRRYVFH